MKIKDVKAPVMSRKQIKIEADSIAEAAVKLATAIREEGVI